MSNLVRVILTFNNPSKYELVHLLNVIYTGKSLSEQQIFIASPVTDLLHYSSDRLENIKLIHELSLNDISPEFLKKFREDYRDNKKYLK